MPKIKTRKAAAKRFKLTKGGKKGAKIFRYKAGKKHILEHKPRSKKRKMNNMVEISSTDRRRVRLMIGGIRNG